MAIASPEHLLAPERLTTDKPRRVSREPRLSVIIINYRRWEETAQLVSQLESARGLRRGTVEIMIVDNHSPPHSLASRLRRRPGVSVRRWGRNRGYARAVNEGCRLSRSGWLLLLNPDVSVDPGFVDGVRKLARQLDVEDKRVGVVGFRLRNSDGTPQLSTGRFPTLLGTLTGLVLPRARRKYVPVHSQRRCRVPWVTGCCFLVRRECLRQLGGFDEDFFLYYEDVDFCRRARANGWTVWYEPTLRAVHHRPLHARAVPSHLRLCTRHALLTYSSKHWPTWQFRLLATIVKGEAWLRQRWAGWRGDAVTAERFGELALLATEMTACRHVAARRRLERVLRTVED